MATPLRHPLSKELTMTEPTPYSAPQQPYAAAAGAPAPKWNTLAIISLVASVIGVHLAGIITGHIALNQIKKTGEQGNVLAIIGLILGYLGIVVVVILGIVWIGILVAAGTSGYTSY
jgi:hypothetical protein